MSELGQWVTELWRAHPTVVVQSVGIGVQLVAFAVTAIVVYYNFIDRPLQRHRIYIDLEFEASRIFTICVDHPDIIAFLENKSDVSGPQIEEKSYWFVCQCLNAFEIMITFRQERMVSTELFATWGSWFHELGTSERFEVFWLGRGLWSHYKDDLQQVMKVAIDLRKKRNGAETDLRDELKLFYRKLAAIFKDEAIFEFYVAAAKRNHGA